MLKQTLVSLAVAAIMAVPASAQQGMKMQAPEGKDVTITGTVIDVSCKFGQGLSGAEHKMCSEVCADRGLPLAVLGSDGQLYIPASAGMDREGRVAGRWIGQLEARQIADIRAVLTTELGRQDPAVAAEGHHHHAQP